VPTDAPAVRIIARLVQLMELPMSGPDGQPLAYKFHHRSSGRQLREDETLAAAGCRRRRRPAAGPGDHGGCSVKVDLDDRYARQRLLTWWDQGVLAASRVLVVGAGALGNEIAKNLALVGVGHLTIIDLDEIERSNLSRCVFFRPGDEGRSKAELAAERVENSTPRSRSRPIHGSVMALGLGVWPVSTSSSPVWTTERPGCGSTGRAGSSV
jgi:hypothetical protein